MTLAGATATGPDLLRLVAVPVFCYAAIRDVKSRRVSSTLWIPLAVLGGVLLVWDGWNAFRDGSAVWYFEFLVPAAIGFGFVVPIAYLFWWIGGFGGADAKALMVLALLFPTFPTYVVGSITVPHTVPPVGAFPLSTLTNAVLVALVVPLALTVRNALAGRLTPVMFVGWPIPVADVPRTHGRLLQTPTGFTRRGLDLDALRMYLRWRGLTLAELRSEPSRYRDPESLPDSTNPPTDGAVDPHEADREAAAIGAVTEGESEPDDASAVGVATADIESATGIDGKPTNPNAPFASDSDSDSDFTADSDSDSDFTADSDSDSDSNSNSDSDSDFTADSDSDSAQDDPWGAATFLAAIDGSAYGTTPDQLRAGLDVLASEESVWISPGTPFLVPIFLGLVIAILYGDVFISVLY